MNSLSPDAIRAMSRDPEYLRYLAKDATAADVHVSTTGKKPAPRKKPLTFTAAIEQTDKDDDENVAARQKMIDALPAETAKALGLKQTQVGKIESERSLKPHPDGGAYSPFPHDAQAMSRMHEEQMRPFLAALTNQDAQDDRRVGLNTLVSLQPRVAPDKIASMREARTDGSIIKKPLVVRFSGKNYLADGHHRAAAAWLDGEKAIDVKYSNISGGDDGIEKGEDEDEIVEWSIPIALNKTDAARQLVFGYASVVQQDGQLIIDKQDDGITPETLEDAVYDYVIEARDHGDMHKVIGTGQLVESMVFTIEKQQALGIVLKNKQGQQIVAWWVGFKIKDADVWKRIKSGELPEFSIGGSGKRVEI